MPAAFSVHKVNSLVMCLCRLHNYCLDENAAATKPLAIDSVSIRASGGFFTIETEDNPESPEALLHGGEHNEDTDLEERRAFARPVLY